MKQKLNKVLILRLSALGDTIHTLPLAYAIKQAYPDCKIGWVVEDKAALFIKNNPLIDKSYVLPKKEWKRRGSLSFENFKDFKNIIAEINSENYDVVLDTQQLFKSASLLPFLRIRRKITLSGGREFSGFFANETPEASHSLFDPDYHVVKRNLELASYLGADTSDVKFVLKPSTDDVVSKIDTLLSSLDSDKKTVVISPATTWENKHWIEKNWSEVVDFLNGKTNIVFTGMESDKPLIERIIQHSVCKNALVLAGKTNLEELAEVFKRSDVVLSPDSGSAHIAWAVSKPSVITLFFATAENRNAPFGENCYNLAPKLDCHPCMKRKCRLIKDSNKCCSMVDAQDVINLLKSTLHLV